jgi:hypothetical protein
VYLIVIAFRGASIPHRGLLPHTMAFDDRD